MENKNYDESLQKYKINITNFIIGQTNWIMNIFYFYYVNTTNFIYQVFTNLLQICFFNYYEDYCEDYDEDYDEDLNIVSSDYFSNELFNFTCPNDNAMFDYAFNDTLHYVKNVISKHKNNEKDENININANMNCSNCSNCSNFSEPELYGLNDECSHKSDENISLYVNSNDGVIINSNVQKSLSNLNYIIDTNLSKQSGNIIKSKIYKSELANILCEIDSLDQTKLNDITNELINSVINIMNNLGLCNDDMLNSIIALLKKNNTSNIQNHVHNGKESEEGNESEESNDYDLNDGNNECVSDELDIAKIIKLADGLKL